MERKHQEDLSNQKALLLAEKQEWQKNFTSKVLCCSLSQRLLRDYKCYASSKHICVHSSGPHYPITGAEKCGRTDRGTAGLYIGGDVQAIDQCTYLGTAHMRGMLLG